MSSKVVHYNGIGAVTFNKNRRSKNIKISVKPDKSVLISYPFYATKREVMNFLVKSEEWIKQRQSEFDKKKRVYDEGDVVETRMHSVLLERGNRNEIKMNGEVVNLFLRDFNSEESLLFIKNALTEIYRHEAKMILPGKLMELASMHGFRYNKVTIRNNRRNWGSCSSKNNISLNLHLMRLPDHMIDYVLLHELVHTEIRNHGKEFWEKLNKITGNRAVELAKQVKQFSTIIH